MCKRLMRRAKTVAVAILAAVTASGCAPSDVIVRHRIGALRHLHLPDIGPNVEIGQRFRVPDGTLRSIDLRTSSDGAPKGTVHIELRTIAGEQFPAMRLADVAAADF